MWNAGPSQTTDDAVISQDGAHIQSSKLVNHYQNAQLFSLSSGTDHNLSHQYYPKSREALDMPGTDSSASSGPLPQHGSGPEKFALNVESSQSRTERKQKNIKRYKGKYWRCLGIGFDIFIEQICEC